ncbi:MAG: hypothetical protein ACF8R7_07790 [Phycisphaerales bacterium JB039]
MKVCRICGQDCSTRPRVKDPQGNYYCKTCLEAHQAKQKAQAPPPPEEPEGFDLGAQLGGDPGDDLGGYDLAEAVGDSEPAAGAGGGCPNCGAPMAASAALCVNCGYSPAGGKGVKTTVSVEREPKVRKPRSGAGAAMLSGLFDESPILPIISLLVHGGLFVAAMDSEDMALLFFGVAGIIWLGVWLWGLVLMFMDSVLHAIVGFICGLYWLYWVVMNSDNKALQLLTLVSILAWILGRFVLGFPEEGP